MATTDLQIEKLTNGNGPTPNPTCTLDPQVGAVTSGTPWSVRIDAETSDYYLLGFYSNNPDPLRRNRRIEVKATRPDVATVWSRKGYSLKSTMVKR